MDILGASVLFTRANNTHSQISEVARRTRDPKFIEMLKEMDAIYRLPNTRDSREKLQKYIIDYGEEIYREFSKEHLNFGRNDFGYDLKPQE